MHSQVMGAVWQPLREKALMLMSYIDDSLHWQHLFAKALFVLEQLLRLLSALAITLSIPKCQLWPRQSAAVLGKLLDTVGMEVSLPPAKVADFKQLAAQLLQEPSPSKRDAARVAGKIISFEPAVQLGRLYVRSLFAIMKGITGWDDKLLDLPSLRDELRFWIGAIDRLNGSSWVAPALAVTIHVDTSALGMGAVVESGPFQGTR